MDFFEQLIQQLINGVSLGSIYALIALGYTMVYGIIKLINFAHGDIYMVGAYVGFYAVSMAHFSIIPSLIISMIVTAVLGILVERIAYKPLRRAPRLSLLITAIGVSFFLEYTSMYFVSPTPRTFPNVVDIPSINIGSFIINGQQLMIFIITIILMVVLTYIVQKTKMGKAMRAVSYDTETAQLMGINADRIISFTFGIGSAPAAVLGGIGSIPGAMTGGIVLGVVEALISGFISSTFRDAAAFAILILVLLFKPSGIFGKNTNEKV